jgi:hypothetical protein
LGTSQENEPHPLDVYSYWYQTLVHLEDEFSFPDWSPVSDTSMSIHLEDEVRFPDWSPMSDTRMSIHLEDEVSFPDWN